MKGLMKFYEYSILSLLFYLWSSSNMTLAKGHVSKTNLRPVSVLRTIGPLVIENDY